MIGVFGAVGGRRRFRKRGISLMKKMMMSKASTYKLRKRTCSLEDGGDFDSAEPSGSQTVKYKTKKPKLPHPPF